MTRALFLFFARPLQMAAGLLVAEALTVAGLLLGIPPAWVPYAAALVAITLVPGPVLSVEPIGNWDRSWPVPESTLLWTRVVPAWMSAWAPVVGAEIGATILWAGGTLAPEGWREFTFHVLLIFGALPLLGVLMQRRGTTLVVHAVVVASFTLSYWFAGDSSPDVASSATVAADLVSAALAAVLGCGLAVVLAPICMLHVSSAGQPAPFRVVPSPAARGRLVGELHPRRGVSAGRWERVRRACSIAQYFYAHPAERTIGLGWAFLVAMPAMALYEFGAFLWMITVTSWPSAYLGVVKPGPLPAHLPVARERLLAFALFPLFLSALLASSVEYLWSPAEVAVGALTYRAERSVRRSAAGPEPPVRITVPIFAWRASWGPPDAIGPIEGMAQPLEGHAVVPGLPLQIYNPYAARLNAERRFVNQQVSRVFTEFLGQDVSPVDVEGACAELRGTSEYFPAKCLRIALRASYRPPLEYFLVRLTLLAAVVWLHFAAYLWLPVRWTWVTSVLSLAVVSLVTFGIVLVLESMDERDPTGLISPFFSLGVLVAELVRAAERAPVITAALALAALCIMFWDLTRRFRRLELFSGRW